ncbi:MAG TPA: MliC family protein [Cyclobacteriaceae bacterium]|nr:MliC family protein [Cyclobacteriaceae bacterium]
MIKRVLTITLVVALFLNSCKEASKHENAETKTTETTEKDADEVVTIISTDKAGNKLEVSFNDMKGTATLNFDGEIIELVEQKAASGFWYKIENYELTGKGNDIELKKDGKVVFTHKDDIVTTSLKNGEGQTLDMTFNNTTNRAKIYLNGGEQIELVGQNPASGIWYKNDHYELRGKGESVELTKDGKTVFIN